MLDYFRRLVALASNKITTYVAIAIGCLSQVAEHAQNIVDMWPSLAQYVPDIPIVKTVIHYVISALGVLVIFTRVRRLLKS